MQKSITTQDTRLYLIQVDGLVGADFINARSPLTAGISHSLDSTRCAVLTDQSGLIGFLRHLHARGFVLLSFTIHQDQSGGSNASQTDLS